tara:strand:- start:7646 stop:8386 length:741 start_codon:yes stop_codon:yes gene_type:complete
MKFIKANVFHRRNLPKVNKFLYKCNYVSIKLPAEDINTKFFSLNKLNILSVNEKDYANGSPDLFKWCSELIEKKYKNKIDSLELITMPKILGYAFNPVSFIFCYSKNNLICTILKVNNTFSEDHYYINYAAKLNEGHEQNYDIEKLFHVSPFLPREGYYKIKYRNDNDCINFNIDYYNGNNDKILETYITGKKITIENNFMIFANVFNSAYLVTRVIYLIHFQAVKLFFKKAKFYKKPKQNINKIT